MPLNNNEENENLWDEFESASTESYLSVWDESLDYYGNCVGLFEHTLYHSEIFILKHILAAYTGFHSVAANFAPILFFSGASGTGKSQTSNLIAAIRETKESVLGGSSTFASVRNVLQRNRWIIKPESIDEPQDTRRSNEKACMLIWADIKVANLSDPKMFGLLRNGTSREEDRLTIAGDAGKNYEFYVFAPKVLSSVEDFYNESQYSELKRRLLLIKTQKMKPDSVHASTWLETAINPSDYDFKGCKKHFKEFWSRDNLLALAGLKKTSGINTRLKKREWSSDYITAYRDLILQHTILSGMSLSEVIKIWEKFIDIQEASLSQSSVNVDFIVSQFIADAETRAKEVELVQVRIEHNLIHARLLALKLRAYTEQVAPIMQTKGYAHEINGNTLTWVKVLE